MLLNPPVPSKVYKHCLELLRIPWKMLRVIWRRGTIVEQWQVKGIWIPKEDNSIMEQFHSILPLNVEGKIFSTILARKMMEFLLKHKYIDTSVGKGGIPEYQGA